ncbi:MAG: hypothetical protein KGJ79_12570 [Alphaproteobacteria bacterium]|nr:hypothetical protein [Alphaproteobacteria bacterium]MDE2111970.1 hypothetical protein [Alphaproteobacteria bacterium]MDE2492534.1 hypothetical protein [Alphaproteobacteria bacterium]
MHMQIRQSPGSVRLSAVRRRLIYGFGAGVWTSGTAWLILHYFMMQKTDFGPAPNPTEPWALAVHAAFGFAVVWLLGLLWGVHVTRGWRMGRHRVSGVTLLAILGWLVVSGYLLYYVGSDEVRSWVSIAHWTLGLALPIPFFVHWLLRNR